ncbi:flippase [Alkalibacillus sp. S2W]|uniref:flippase n=1 Tax=Alkalibacillus sp. S2W TaxID=3386553 RepID=UPI00398D1846
MNKELKNITRQSGVVFVGKIIGLLFGLLFNLIAARLLGAEIFGQFTLLYTFISFFPILAMLGLHQGLVYYIPKFHESGNKKFRNEIITVSYVLVFLISILLSFLIFINGEFITSTFFESSEEVHIKLLQNMAPILILLTIIQLSQGVFRGLKNINPFVLSQDFIIPLSKVIVFLIVIGLVGASIVSVLITYYISLVFGVFYLLYIINKNNLFSNFSIEAIKSYKEILKYSLPLLFTGFLGFITKKSDILMIGYFLEDQQVGIYKIALQLGTMSSFILVAFNMIFAPTISSLFHKGEITQLETMYKTITKWVFSVNLVAFVLIVLFKQEIMFIFGSEFVLGANALLLVSIGQLVNAGVGSAGYILMMTGHPKLEMYNNLLIVIVNITLNILLIPSYGIEGAAFASLVSVMLANIIKLILVYVIHKIHPYNRDYIKVLLSITSSFIIVFLLRNLFNLNSIVEFILFSIMLLILFLITLKLFGFSKDDKLLIDQIKFKNRSNRLK